MLGNTIHVETKGRGISRSSFVLERWQFERQFHITSTQMDSVQKVVYNGAQIKGNAFVISHYVWIAHQS